MTVDRQHPADPAAAGRSSAAADKGAPTRAEALRRALEAQIFAGRWRPGERLDEQALAAQFGVSRTPVREALRTLASAGLVEIRPNRGALVAPLTLSRIIEMFEVMAALEGLCARLACRRISAKALAELRRIHQAAQPSVTAGLAGAYYHLNRRFHERIYGASGNAFLEEHTRAIRNRLEPYRRHQLNQRGRIPSSYAEHGALLDAIEARDEDAAERLMRQHIGIQGDVFADLIAAVEGAQSPSSPATGRGRRAKRDPQP
jgi:DNA-binding GntR family transcriptional regulator